MRNQKINDCRGLGYAYENWRYTYSLQAFTTINDTVSYMISHSIYYGVVRTITPKCVIVCKQGDNKFEKVKWCNIIENFSK